MTSNSDETNSPGTIIGLITGCFAWYHTTWWIGLIVFSVVGTFIDYNIKKKKRETDKNVLTRPAYSQPARSYSCPPHDWKFSHKGADKTFPRGHYRCRKCQASGVEENLGDGNIQY